jgi:DNA-directed RNA polymerase specialized sigma24 family protein
MHMGSLSNAPWIAISSRKSSTTVRTGTRMDFKDPGSLLVLEALRTAKCEEGLLKFAIWLTGTEADGKDLLRDTLYRMCDSIDGVPWDPERGSVATHARFVMKQLARKRWRSARAKREVLTDRDAIDDTHESDGPSPDEVIDRATQAAQDRQRGELLRQRLNPLSRKVFDYRCGGIEDAAELARLCSCKRTDIYLANKLIVHHANRVLVEERQAEEERKLNTVRPLTKRRLAPWYKAGYGDKS